MTLAGEGRPPMAKEQDRGKDEPTTTKPKEHDKKLTDLTAEKKDEVVKGGGGAQIGTTGGEDRA
jgi:hypothetical protein